VFAFAAAGKLLDFDGSRQAIEEFGIAPRLARIAGPLLPFAEIAVAAALVIRPTALIGAAGALILLAAFVGGVGFAMAQGRSPECHCFGRLRSEPAGPSTIARNAVLAAPALLILAAGSGPSLYGALAGLNRTQAALVAVSVLALVLAAGVDQLWRENRALRRDVAVESGPRPTPGLPRGTPAPAFALAAVGGGGETLERLRQPVLPVVLVFVSTRCGPCLRMLPALAGWQEALSERLSLAVIFSGDRAEITRIVEEHGLGNALVQERSEVFLQYALGVTPSAVLIGTDGTIAATPAEGSHAIEALIRSVASEPVGEPVVIHA
jgi:thiol-disulfide isomerase/thioredoxin